MANNYNIKINGKAYNVTIEGIDADGKAKVTVNGKERTVEIEQSAAASKSPASAALKSPVSAAFQSPASAGDQSAFQSPATAGNQSAFQSPASAGSNTTARNAASKSPASAGNNTTASNAAEGKGSDIVSPLPGVIIKINVAVGDKVAAGQSVATLEAMKMENEIEAEKAGTVQAIYVQKGDSVLEGAKIITIA